MSIIATLLATICFILLRFVTLKMEVSAFSATAHYLLRCNKGKGHYPRDIRQVLAREIKRREASLSLLNVIAKSGGEMINSLEVFNNLVLQKEQYDKPIQLVFFSAAWCGPCRLTVPVVKEITKQFQTQLSVYEINTDDLAEVAEDCGVISIPTIQLYSKGIMKDTIVGCVATNVLAASVAKLLEELAPSSKGDGNHQR